MVNELIKKHLNDPSWEETIRLFSGLFDSYEFRDGFLFELAEFDILLTAKCITASISKEKNTENFITQKAIQSRKKENGFYEPKKVFLTLIELNRTEEIIPLLLEGRYKGQFKSIINEAIQNYDLKRIVDFSEVIYKVRDKDLVLFFLLSLTKEKIKNSEHNLLINIDLIKQLFEILKIEKIKSIRLSKMSRSLSIGIRETSELIGKISIQSINSNPNKKIELEHLYQGLYNYLINNILPDKLSKLETKKKNYSKYELSSKNNKLQKGNFVNLQ